MDLSKTVNEAKMRDTEQALTVVIEIKATREFTKLDNLCGEALCQIEKYRYETELKNEGYQNIIKYGIAFCKKSCRVKIG